MKPAKKQAAQQFQPQALPPLDPLQRYAIPEAARYLRKARATLYLNIKAGTIKTITDGSRRYVPGSEIARLSSLGGAAA